MKRILITGSRDWTDVDLIFDALNAVLGKVGTDITVVHGGARGADNLAGTWASIHEITEEIHRADWEKHGKRAGMVRNAVMVNKGADICLAFIRNESPGATMAAGLAEKAGIPVYRFTR